MGSVIVRVQTNRTTKLSSCLIVVFLPKIRYAKSSMRDGQLWGKSNSHPRVANRIIDFASIQMHVGQTTICVIRLCVFLDCLIIILFSIGVFSTPSFSLTVNFYVSTHYVWLG